MNDKKFEPEVIKVGDLIVYDNSVYRILDFGVFDILFIKVQDYITMTEKWIKITYTPDIFRKLT